MMSPVRLNPLDAAWILTEARATPNHVGGLLQFRLPDDAPRDFMRELVTAFRSHRDFTPPWNRRMRFPLSVNPMPVWAEDDDIDLEYHVRHAALPWPGGERELGELVGRLQSTPIDLSRPPWECTIIEGLEGHRFALFIKMHHSLIDGISGMKLLQRAMSTDREKSLGMPPFWSSGSERAPRPEAGAPPPTFANVAAAAVKALSGQVQTVPQLVAAFGKIVKRIGDPGEGMVVPFVDSPRSMLNGRIREKRRFATQQFSLERMRTLARAADCTLNDVVLAICSGALRRFLHERDELPERSLTAGIPMSVRPKDDERTGNAITFIIARLGTDIADPVKRLDAIRTSVQFAKAHVQSLPKQAMEQYTMLLMAPTLITMLTGIGGRVPPMFNVTISNVPGPDKPLYFRGAELLATYPASIVQHGLALNITCQSYAGSMNFGFTGCHSSVPSLQRLAVFSADAFDELEEAILRPPPVRARKGPRPRSGAKPRAAKVAGGRVVKSRKARATVPAAAKSAAARTPAKPKAQEAATAKATATKRRPRAPRKAARGRRRAAA
jgi:WS/DGAT/MGAT family acyltransferase